jgi:acyl dehydratase
MTNTDVRLDSTFAPADDLEVLIRTARHRIGCLAPGFEAGVDVASWINISRFVEATGDENPLFTDVQYGAGSAHYTMLAPGTFVLAVRAPDSNAGLDLHQHQMVETIRSLWLSWDDTIRLADRLTGEVRITDVAPCAHGPGAAQVSTYAHYERNGTGFARGGCTVELLPTESAFPQREVHRYGKAEIERMMHALDDETPPRGSQPRFWSDTTIGDIGPTLLKGPLTLAELMVWAFAEGTPIPAGNLYHTRLEAMPGRRTTNPVTAWPDWDRTEAWIDSAASQAGGLSAPAAKGGLLFALAGQYATHWMGDDGFLWRLDAELRRPLQYGDALWVTGTVTDQFTTTDEGGHRYHAVVLTVTGSNQLGETIVSAEAVIFLPDRGKPVALPVVGSVAFE